MGERGTYSYELEKVDMTLDKKSSMRLNVLRFPLMVGVVYIHAYASEVTMNGVSTGGGGEFSNGIRNLISQGVARISVPLFFMISGYLYFLKFDGTLASFKGKIRSRFRTLVIPFIFWNLLVLCLIGFAQFIPTTKAFFSGDSLLVCDFRARDFFEEILGLRGSPIAYQFWFIRDLMIMALITPFLYKTMRFGSVLSFLLLAAYVCLFSGGWSLLVAITFFYIGAYLAYSKKSLFELDRFEKILACVYLPILILDVYSKGEQWGMYVHNMGVILGSTVALCVSRKVVMNCKYGNFLVALGTYSFFVFAAHEPLLTVLRKISYKLVTPVMANEWCVLLLYILLPIIVIVLTLLGGITLQRLIPRFFAVVSGGR